MATDIKAPQFPESVADGTIATWHKQVGEACSRDDLLVDIETDKVVLEVVAPGDGALKEIVKGEGDTVLSNELIAVFEEGASGGKTAEPAAAAPAAAAAETGGDDEGGDALASPAARRIADEKGINLSAVKGSGKGGKITKEDVEAAAKNKPAAAPAAAPAPAAATPVAAPGERTERRVAMTRMRKRIAERLVMAQQEAAMLTTFNEVNMKPVMELRRKHQDKFVDRHGVKLGFMSFFVKAAVEALKRIPSVNASIDGDDVVYHGYYDIGVAVSAEKGLVVPVLRDANLKGLAEIESQIIEYGKKARDGKLSIEEMTGGTFTISNGGVFGSLLSTPILNPPQTGILGMHKIQERPMVVNGQIEILPMMYLALSYDHRLIDGKEAVSFVIEIKNLLEDPARILLDI